MKIDSNIRIEWGNRTKRIHMEVRLVSSYFSIVRPKYDTEKWYTDVNFSWDAFHWRPKIETYWNDACGLLAFLDNFCAISYSTAHLIALKKRETIAQRCQSHVESNITCSRQALLYKLIYCFVFSYWRQMQEASCCLFTWKGWKGYLT